MARRRMRPQNLQETLMPHA
jgi:hypothetical protein